MSSSSEPKEIEWWNEIRPWKNSENDELPSSSVCRTFIGACPLTFDGAFGLTVDQHRLQICCAKKQVNKNICLFQHFHGKHGFTHRNSIRLVQAVIRDENPHQVELFSSNSNSTIYKIHHRVRCPLASRNEKFPCSKIEIRRKSIRRHLLVVHQLEAKRVDDLIENLYK